MKCRILKDEGILEYLQNCSDYGTVSESDWSHLSDSCDVCDEEQQVRVGGAH